MPIQKLEITPTTVNNNYKGLKADELGAYGNYRQPW